MNMLTSKRTIWTGHVLSVLAVAKYFRLLQGFNRET